MMQTIQLLFADHQDYLRAFALKLTKGDATAAADLLQETYARIWRNAARFEEGTNFRAWASTILRNQFINDYRKLKYRRHTSIEESGPTEMDRFNHVDNRGEGNIKLEEINGAIDRLQELYRIPFLLYVQGFQYQEISEQMGIALGTVKSRIHFARKQLQVALADA